MSRLQPFVATDSEDVLRPSVGEGATPVCERGLWVGQVGVSVGLVWGGSSGVGPEQEKMGRWDRKLDYRDTKESSSSSPLSFR